MEKRFISFAVVLGISFSLLAMDDVALEEEETNRSVDTLEEIHAIRVFGEKAPTLAKVLIVFSETAPVLVERLTQLMIELAQHKKEGEELVPEEQDEQDNILKIEQTIPIVIAELQKAPDVCIAAVQTLTPEGRFNTVDSSCKPTATQNEDASQEYDIQMSVKSVSQITGALSTVNVINEQLTSFVATEEARLVEEQLNALVEITTSITHTIDSLLMTLSPSSKPISEEEMVERTMGIMQFMLSEQSFVLGNVMLPNK